MSVDANVVRTACAAITFLIHSLLCFDAYLFTLVLLVLFPLLLFSWIVYEKDLNSSLH